MAAGRETGEWELLDYAIVGGIGLVVLAIVFSGGKSAVALRRTCSQYEQDFRQEVEEGRLKRAESTEQRAREVGCRWAKKFALQE